MATSKVTVHFPCPVEQVWKIVTDLSNTAWRSDLTRVEVLAVSEHAGKDDAPALYKEL